MLCYLEGKTREEAAQQLGWSVGTVKSRLEPRPRKARRRLVKRGITMSAGLLTTLLTQTPASALPYVLAGQTVRFARYFTAGQAGGPAASIGGLAKAVLLELLLIRLKAALVIVLLGFATIGAGAWMVGTAAAPVQTALPDLRSILPKVQQPPKTELPQAAPVDRFGDALPAHAMMRLGTVRFRQDSMLAATAISPDGSIVAGMGQTAVQLWDAQTGRTLRYLQDGHFNIDGALAFSRDGKLLASFSTRGKLLIADVATGKTMKEFERRRMIKEGQRVTSGFLAFLPGGKQLVLKDGVESVVHLLDADSGNEIREFRSEGRFLQAVALSPDDLALAVAEENGTVRIWETATGKERLAIKLPAQSYTTLAFAPDGLTLATAGPKDVAAAYLWDSLTGKLLQTLSGVNAVTRSLNFAPDGKTLVSAHVDVVVLWDPATGKELRRLNHFPATDVQFLADGKTLFAGAMLRPGQNTCWFLDSATGKPFRRFDGHNSDVVAITCSSDGKFVATGDSGKPGEFRVWEMDSGRVVLQQAARNDVLNALVFSPKGDKLALGCDRSVILWDVKADKELWTVPLGQDRWNCRVLAFSADGTKLASGTAHGIVSVLNCANGKELQHLILQNGDSAVLAFSPDMRLAATSASDDKAIHLWNIASGKLERSFPGGAANGRQTYLAFSHDGRTLLEIAEPTQLFLWEVATGQRRLALPFAGFANTAAFSADSRKIAVGGLKISSLFQQRPKRPTIQTFDLVGNRLAGTLLGHAGTVHALSFSPDGRSLASGSADTTAFLWDIAGLDANGHIPAASLTPEQSASCWNDLRGNAEQAYAGMCKLVDHKGTTEFLRKELQPAPAAADAEVVARLLLDLDSDQFAVRSKAHEQLGKLGLAAERQLRKVLTSKTTLELRQRVEKLVDTLESLQYRTRRAVEVLEWIDTPAAGELLQSLAQGPADDLLTRDAKESLERLSRRPAR